MIPIGLVDKFYPKRRGVNMLGDLWFDDDTGVAAASSRRCSGSPVPHTILDRMIGITGSNDRRLEAAATLGMVATLTGGFSCGR